MKIFICITAILLHTLPIILADECAELEQKFSELVCDESEFEDYFKCVKERSEVRRKRQLICPLTGQPINQVIDAIRQPQHVVQPIITQDVLPMQQGAYQQAAQVAPIVQQEVYQQPAQIVQQEVYQQPAQVVQQEVYQQPAQVVQQQVQYAEPIFSNQVHSVPPIVTQDIIAPIQETVKVENQQQPMPQPRYILQSSQDDLVNHNVEVVGKDTTYRHTQVVPAPRNITTVIRLNNYINNTNHINVPTMINSTNINNITIYTNFTDKYGLGATETGSCCFAVQPKRCHSTPTGPRCHHKRHKTCGPQCTSRIIHVRKGQNCGSQGCDISYAPQPSPKCVYTETWPYVSCGHRRKNPCDGCYDYPYGPYYQPPQECNGCYDEGFEYGQMYRRGPVLRPQYQPQPPCQLTGDCEDYDSGFNREPDIYEDSDGNSTEIENDLGMVLHKCKVVSDDGSIMIRNCTIEQDHPFGSVPSFDLQRNQRSYMPPPPPPPPPMYYPPAAYYGPPAYGYGYPYYQPYPVMQRPMRHHHHKHHDEPDYIPPRPVVVDDDDNIYPED